MKAKKILAINFGGIGDEILFFPVLKSLKSTYSKCHITLVTEPRSASCKNLTNNIDEIITCDIKSKNKYFELLKFLLKVRSEHFDIAISSGSSKMVAVLLFLTGAKKRYGYEAGKLSQILLTKTVKLHKKQYAANMYHDLLKPLCKDAKCSIPGVYVSDENLNLAFEMIGNKSKTTVIIHPGVSRMSIQKNIIKFWDTKNWADLVIRLVETGKYKIILAGGSDDEATIQQIKSELNKSDIDKNNIIDTLGKTKNISQLAGLIKMSDAIVCVDSAPMHIGIGVNTNVIALFGPTDEKKLVPQNQDNIKIIKNNENTCRPCLWDKRQVSCDVVDCLKIDVENVFKTIEEIFTKSASPL